MSMPRTIIAPNTARLTLMTCLALISCPAVAIDELTVYALFNGRAILVIDGQRHVLSNGETSPEGVKLITSTTRGAVVEIDGRREEIGLHIVPASGGAGDTTVAEVGERQVVIESNERGLFHVEGAINGHDVTFLVDTGADTVAMSTSAAASFDIDYESGRVSLASTANGAVPMYAVTLDRVTVGTIELDDIPAAIITDPGPDEVLLGMSFLRQLEISQDGDTMTLTHR